MTDKLREAAKEALELLDKMNTNDVGVALDIEKVRARLRSALAQPSEGEEALARQICDIFDKDPDEAMCAQTNFGSHEPAWKIVAPYLASRSIAPAGGEWAPMETAPKDGTIILAALVFADGSSGGVHTILWIDGTWRVSAVGSIRFAPTGDEWDDRFPTHWRPLPAPPVTREER